MTGEEEGAKSDESGDSWRRYGGRLQCAPASDSACRRRQPSAFGAARCGSKGLTEREEVAVWAQRMKPEEAGPNHHQKKKKKNTGAAHMALSGLAMQLHSWAVSSSHHRIRLSAWRSRSLRALELHPHRSKRGREQPRAQPRDKPYIEICGGSSPATSESGGYLGRNSAMHY